MRKLSCARIKSTSSVGCIGGHDVDDWLQAEHELLEKYANVGRIAKGAGA
jgi:hypothetical protein